MLTHTWGSLAGERISGPRDNLRFCNLSSIMLYTIIIIQKVECTRAFYLGQYATVNVTQLMKTQQEVHKKIMEKMAAKGKGAEAS